MRLALLLTLAASPALAQDTDRVREATIRACDQKPALSCFVDQTSKAHDLCALVARLGQDARGCVTGSLQAGEVLYAKASAKPATRGMVKDYYAEWRAAMQAITPLGTETPRAYEARQAAAKSVLAAKAERLRLE
jgi:hypothetical protein